jgi:hypothetical protein
MEKRSDEILELLRSKNRCLDRLMAETRTFLAVPVEALVSEVGSKIGPLTTYEDARASIIRMIELLDQNIAGLIQGLLSVERTPEFIASTREEIQRNERLIISVFNADDIVFRKIGDAQGQITKLIQENRKSRDLLGKFKSASGQTGEGMDKTL